MNSRIRLLAGLALGAVVAVSASAFEGRVTLAIKSGREAEQVIRYEMKGTRFRVEPQVEGMDGGVAMILDTEKQEMVFLMPAEKMYLARSLKGGVAAAAADRAEKAELRKTGRTETILGYACEEYAIQEGKETTEVWLTDRLGSFVGLALENPMAGMMGGGQAKRSGWEETLKGRAGAFPMRVVTRDARGRETARVEVRQVEPGPVADDAFLIPPGFQKLALPGLSGLPGFGG